MTVYYANVRSVRNKLDEIKVLVGFKRPHILLFVESWLHSDIEDNEIKIDGYKIFRRDRDSVVKSRGGGLLIYVQDNINVIEISESLSFNIECLWIKVLGEHKNLNFGLYYRPPNSNESDDLEMFNSIRKLMDLDGIVIGDFNYPKINWKLLCSDIQNDKFLKLVADKFLIQHVKFNTRGENILDLVLSTDKSLLEVELDHPLSNSDHNSLLITVNLPIKENNVTRDGYYDYKNGNYEKIIQELNLVNWSEFFLDDDVNGNWVLFKNKIESLVNLYVAWKNCKVVNKSNAKWMNGKIARLINIKGKKWKKFNKTGNFSSWHDFKVARNKLCSSIKKARKNYELKLSSNINNNSKEFYAYVNSKKSKNDTNITLKLENGEVISEPIDVANSLNNYFASVYTEEVDIINPEENNKSKIDLDSDLCNISINEELVLNEFNKMKVNKSGGPDGLTTNFLIKIKHSILKPLTFLFTESFTSGIVPENWKEALVTPLFKKGKKCSIKLPAYQSYVTNW